MSFPWYLYFPIPDGTAPLGGRSGSCRTDERHHLCVVKSGSSTPEVGGRLYQLDLLLRRSLISD